MNRISRGLRRFGAALLVGGAGLAAQAAPTVFVGLDNSNLSGGGAHPNADAAAAAFATAAGSLATQGFEAFAAGAAVPASFAVGSVHVGFTNLATVSTAVATGVGTFSTFPTHGTRFIDSLTDPGTSFFRMNFDRGVRALGFYLSDPSDWIGDAGPIDDLQVHVLHANGETVHDLLDNRDASTVVNGNVSFFGIVDAANPITGFFITNPPHGQDALGLDQLMLARVDTPATLALLLAGALAALPGRRSGARRTRIASIAPCGPNSSTRCAHS